MAASQGLHQFGFLSVKKRQKRKKYFLKAKTAAWVQCGDIIIVSSDSEKDKNCFNCHNITKIIWVSLFFQQLLNKSSKQTNLSQNQNISSLETVGLNDYFSW